VVWSVQNRGEMCSPSLCSMAEGRVEAATLLYRGGLRPACVGTGVRGAWSQIRREGRREGWIFAGVRLDARKRFYICPPDELAEEVPGPESFLIRRALACSCEGIMIVPFLSCDSRVVVT